MRHGALEFAKPIGADLGQHRALHRNGLAHHDVEGADAVGGDEQQAVVVDGEVEIANERYEGPRLLVFRPGDRITVKAVKPTRTMFLGGDALEGPRHIWWNFVSSSKERIEQAKQDWKTGRFAPVPQEHEFIPLPE